MLDAWYNSRLYHTFRSSTQPSLSPVVMDEVPERRRFSTHHHGTDVSSSKVWSAGPRPRPSICSICVASKKQFPDALIVHVIRDGRDLALSWEKLAPDSTSTRGIANVLAMAAGIYWEWIVNRRDGKLGRTLGADYIEVHYEDVVRRPRRGPCEVGALHRATI